MHEAYTQCVDNECKPFEEEASGILQFKEVRWSNVTELWLRERVEVIEKNRNWLMTAK
jgi:hypothetical protein